MQVVLVDLGVALVLAQSQFEQLDQLFPVLLAEALHHILTPIVHIIIIINIKLVYVVHCSISNSSEIRSCKSIYWKFSLSIAISCLLPIIKI